MDIGQDDNGGFYKNSVHLSVYMLSIILKLGHNIVFNSNGPLSIYIRVSRTLCPGRPDKSGKTPGMKYFKYSIPGMCPDPFLRHTYLRDLGEPYS